MTEIDTKGLNRMNDDDAAYIGARRYATIEHTREAVKEALRGADVRGYITEPVPTSMTEGFVKVVEVGMMPHTSSPPEEVEAALDDAGLDYERWRLGIRVDRPILVELVEPPDCKMAAPVEGYTCHRVDGHSGPHRDPGGVVWTRHSVEEAPTEVR